MQIGIGVRLSGNHGAGPLYSEAEGLALYLDRADPVAWVKDPAGTPITSVEPASSFVTTTRSTVGWRFNSSGLFEQVSTNLPRYNHDFLTGEPLGLLAEPGRVNVCLWNRDLTNAAWTKSSVTAAKDQTGLDGVANSASSITATGANGTALQSVTLASSSRAQSAYVKRLVGSGTLEMTTDNGTTWTAITPGTDWERATIPAQTVTNPVLGFRIGTSGDSFAVDLVQNENGLTATSPMATTTASFSRAIDIHSFAMSGLSFDNSQGTVYLEAVTNGANTESRVGWHISDGTTANTIYGTLSSLGGGQLAIIVASSATANILPGTVVVGGISRLVSAWNSSRAQAALGGAVGTPDTSLTVPSGLTTFSVGAGLSGTSPINGTIRKIVFVPRVAADTELVALSVFGWKEPTSANIVANDARIEDSDYSATLTKSTATVTALRPLTFSNYEYACPGWRRRFNTTATTVIIHLENLDLVSASYNGKIAIYVDGAVSQYLTSASEASDNYVRLDFEDSADRLIEVLMPYSASIAFNGLTLYGGDITAPTSRASLPRAVAFGDSRIQGFNATSTDKHWLEILCRAKGWQHINLGFGSSIISNPANAGAAVVALDPDVVFLMSDYNHKTVQQSLVDYKSTYKTVINDIRASLPSVKIYCITSNWVSAANDTQTIKIADYRAALADALTELADANNILIDGLTLTANNTTSVPDGVHPGDVGQAEFAAAVGAIVTL
jgi:lysophospholipase L1-like esterase